MFAPDTKTPNFLRHSLDSRTRCSSPILCSSRHPSTAASITIINWHQILMNWCLSAKHNRRVVVVLGGHIQTKKCALYVRPNA